MARAEVFKSRAQFSNMFKKNLNSAFFTLLNFLTLGTPDIINYYYQSACSQIHTYEMIRNIYSRNLNLNVGNLDVSVHKTSNSFY